MRAVVLAGGRGTRLRPVTGALPKLLAPFGERTFLDVQLEWLAGLGVDEVRLALGVGAEPVIEWLRTAGPPPGLRVSWTVEPAPLGTAGALRFAAGGAREPYLAVNGDTLAEFDLAALESLHRERDALVTLVCFRVPDASDRGRVEIAADGRVAAFREKAGGGAAWVSGGVYLCAADLAGRVPADGPSSLERDLFPALVAAGEPVFALRSTGAFHDVGTPERLRDAARAWPPARDRRTA